MPIDLVLEKFQFTLVFFMLTLKDLNVNLQIHMFLDDLLVLLQRNCLLESSGHCLKLVIVYLVAEMNNCRDLLGH
jgi:hypothetical protein